MLSNDNFWTQVLSPTLPAQEQCEELVQVVGKFETEIKAETGTWQECGRGCVHQMGT